MEIPSSPLTPRLPDAKLWRATVGDVVEALESIGQTTLSQPSAAPDDVVVLRDATPAAQLSAALRNEPIRPPILPLPPSPALDPPGPSHADVAAARGADQRGPVPADDAPPLPPPLRFAADAARASLAAGRPMPALALLDAAWPASDVPAELHALRAQGLLDVGRETESAEVVARGLAQAPESSALRWLGMQAAVRLDAPEHAAALAMPLLRQVPDPVANRAAPLGTPAAPAPDETGVPAKARTALRVMAQVVVAMGTPAAIPDAVILDAPAAADPEVIDVEVLDAEVVSLQPAPAEDPAAAPAPVASDADESVQPRAIADEARSPRASNAAAAAPRTAPTVHIEVRADAPAAPPQASATDARAHVDAATPETPPARDVMSSEAAARADHAPARPLADGLPKLRADAAPTPAADARHPSAPDQPRADRTEPPSAESAPRSAPGATATPAARTSPPPTERPLLPPAAADSAARAAPSKPAAAAAAEPVAARAAAPPGPSTADAPPAAPPPRSVLFEQRRTAVLTALERVFGPAERHLFTNGDAIRAVERWLAPMTVVDPARQAAARSERPDVAALPREVQLRLLQVSPGESAILPLPAAPQHDLALPGAPSHSTEVAVRAPDAQLSTASAEPARARLAGDSGAAPLPRADADARAAPLTPPLSDPSTLFAWLAVDARLQPAGVLAAQWRRAGEGAVLQAAGAAAAARRSPLPVSWQGVLRLALVGAAIVSVAVGRSNSAVMLGAAAVVWWMRDGRRR